MKILLISVGTRGDIEPFLAIADIMQRREHKILCCFPEQFRDITINAKHNFKGLSSKFLELLDSEEGKVAMGGRASILGKVKAYSQLYKKSSIINRILFNQQQDLIKEFNPDKIIYNIKSIYTLVWSVENHKKSILVSPIPYLIHNTKDFAHIGFNKDYGKIINKLTYLLSNFSLIKSILSVANKAQIEKKITAKKLKAVLFQSKMVYTISPSVFSRPNYWPENVKVLGYHERNKSNIWEADNQLKAFIARHDKILFVTFGSMTNENPEEKTKIILDIVNNYQIPTIFNTSSGGLKKPVHFDFDLVHFVSSIPYDWIFKKVYGVIHHGGSGTTHTALKHGCSSLIIPHIIDQFMWNKIVYNLGVGPYGKVIGKINREILKPLILDLYQNTVYKERAKQISDQMKKENYEEELYQFLTED